MRNIGDRVTFRNMYANGPREITGRITDSWKQGPGLGEGETVYRVAYPCPWLKGTSAFAPDRTDQHVTEDRIL